jgi:hypothetical protein
MEIQNETQIFLPDDYHPLASIEQIEMLLRFTNRAYNCLPDIGKNVSNSNKKISFRTYSDKISFKN